LCPIKAGEYLCNQKIIDALKIRHVDFEMPQTPNIRDHIEPHQVDELTFSPAPLPAFYKEERTFDGYLRSGNQNHSR